MLVPLLVSELWYFSLFTSQCFYIMCVILPVKETLDSCKVLIQIFSLGPYKENTSAKNKVLWQSAGSSFGVLHITMTKASNELCQLEPSFGGDQAELELAESPLPLLERKHLCPCQTLPTKNEREKESWGGSVWEPVVNLVYNWLL